MSIIIWILIIFVIVLLIAVLILYKQGITVSSTQEQTDKMEVKDVKNVVWGIGPDRKVYQRPVDGSENWNVVNGEFDHLSVGNEYVWAISNNGVYKCRRPCTGNWEIVQGQNITQLDAYNDMIWGLNNTGNIYYKSENDSSDWTSIGGNYKDIAISNNYIWAIDPNNHVYNCKKPCEGKWELKDGNIKQINASANEVWGTTEEGKIFYRTEESDWKSVPGYLNQVATGKGYTWGVDRNNVTYRCKNPCTGDWIESGGNIVHLDVNKF